jgi:hypothetical protein
LIISRCYVGVSALAIAVLFQSCATFMGRYGPDGQSLEDFEDRVEAAFRLQNSMTSEVMVLQSDGTDPQQHEPILQAERVMEKNCHDLNDYVSRDIDGKNKSFLLLRRVQDSVLACETSAQTVEELLKIHQR